MLSGTDAVILAACALALAASYWALFRPCSHAEWDYMYARCYRCGIGALELRMRQARSGRR